MSLQTKRKTEEFINYKDIVTFLEEKGYTKDEVYKWHNWVTFDGMFYINSEWKFNASLGTICDSREPRVIEIHDILCEHLNFNDDLIVYM